MVNAMVNQIVNPTVNHMVNPVVKPIVNPALLMTMYSVYMFAFRYGTSRVRAQGGYCVRTTQNGQTVEEDTYSRRRNL